MARVTVEDCLQNVKNRFELVMIAAKRARQLMRGSSEPKVAWENDKATVVALREIAQGYTTFSDTHEIDSFAELTENKMISQHTPQHEEDHQLEEHFGKDISNDPSINSLHSDSDDADTLDPEQHL